MAALSLDTAVLPAALDLSAQGLPAQGPLLLPSVLPVTPAPEVVDAAALVRTVQLEEQEIARQAETAAAEARAVAERAAAEAAERAAAARSRATAKPASASTAASTSAAAPAAASGSADCGLDTSGLGAVKSHVRQAAEFLGCLHGEPDMHGVAGRAGTSDHPSGKAVDFMVDRSTGDALAECALRNQDALGISYVIWEQQINHGNGWEPMEDRGGVTANHFDHVHISFEGSAPSGDPVVDRCS